MVLVLTLRQLSAINCVAYKRPGLALTSLADEHDVSAFFKFLQGCSLPTSCKTSLQISLASVITLASLQYFIRLISLLSLLSK
jgi:hypothetical protein